MALVDFEERDGYTLCIVHTTMAARFLQVAADEIANQCRASGCTRVLIDLTASPGSLEFLPRFEIAERFAEMWPREVRVAVFGREDQDDPSRIWELAVRNRGIEGKVFLEFKQAEEWLRQAVVD